MQHQMRHNRVVIITLALPLRPPPSHSTVQILLPGFTSGPGYLLPQVNYHFPSFASAISPPQVPRDDHGLVWDKSKAKAINTPAPGPCQIFCLLLFTPNIDTSITMATTTDKKIEAPEFAHVNSVLEDEKPSQVEERDWTGTAKKTDPEEIRLVKKLDLWIMPCLCVMYFLNYVDRNAIAQARLNNLEEDLNMTGTEFNTTVSILFVGYVLMQIPSNMLITKVKPGIYMSAWMLVWAAVSACTALVKNYGGLVACRFFLGITEAPFYPGATYMLSIFYTRKEVATRIAALYCAQILATGFSGLIAAGIFAGMDGMAGLAGWRWLFIVEGCATAVVAFIGFFMLPNTPLTTWWLSESEKQLAHARMEKDKAYDSEEGGSAWEGLKQACADKRTWLFCLMQNFHLSACSFNSFFPTVIKTLGFNTTI
ncbi:hypothetical protein F53441_13301, partial [Fusarium austroafricanum]